MCLSEQSNVCGSLGSLCTVPLGFTVTLQPHSAPGCPPARLLLAGLPACGHLFTSSSTSRHECNPLTHTPTPTLWPGRPSPPWPALSGVSPPRHQLGTTHAYPAVLLMQPCHITVQQKAPSHSVLAALCWPTNASFQCDETG